jgi:hypothetical protein
MVLRDGLKIKSIPMNRNLEALIIDDDPFSLAIAKKTVGDRIPEKQIRIRSPIPPNGERCKGKENRYVRYYTY